MRAPYLDDGDVRLYLGDCIEVMAEMDAEIVAARLSQLSLFSEAS